MSDGTVKNLDILPVIRAKGVISGILVREILEARSGIHSRIVLENPMLNPDMNLVMKITLIKEVRYFGYTELQTEIIESLVVIDYSTGNVGFPGEFLHLSWTNNLSKMAVKTAATTIAEFVLGK